MKTILILFVGFITQIIFYNYLSYSGIGVNILMLLTIEISLVRGSHRGEIFGFFSGLIEDILIFGLIGERALFMTVVGFLAGKLKGKFSAENIVFQFFLVSFIYILRSYFIYFLRVLFFYPPVSLKYVIAGAGLNGLAAILIYYLIKRIYAW